MKRTLFSLLAMTAFAASASAADIIAQWNFNSNPPDASSSTGTNTPSQGTGSAASVGGISESYAAGSTADAGATGDNSAWNTSSYPSQGTGNKTAGVEFRTSTVGFETIVITWEQRPSNTGTRYTRLQYSVDGTTFIDGPVITHSTGGGQWSSQTASLSEFAGVEDNPNFAFRLVAEFESTATGAGADSYAAAQSGSSYGTGGTLRYDLLTISGSPATGNISPTISSLTNQTLRVNEGLTDIPFTVGDVETPAGDLLVAGLSSNPDLVPNDAITFGGTGADRTFSLTPTFFASGTAVITLTVTDGGGKTSSSSFLLTVLPDNTAPTISNSFTNYHTIKDVALADIPFTIDDKETAPEELEVIVSSSNPGVIPNENIIVEGTGAERTLKITPASGQFGNSVITVTVGDFVLTTNRSFHVMVVPSATVVLNEPFDYDDGSVTTNSANLWNTHSGIFGQTKLSGGTLGMTSSQTEDINARLIGSPFATDSGTTLYASFIVNFSGLPGEAADYFAHFREAGGAFRCRIFVSTTNSPAGTYRLGIANNNANITNAVTLEGDLDLNVDQLVVVSYDVGTGVSTLWVNPTSEASPSATATDNPSPSAIVSFAFRQSTNIGSLSVDNLKVATSLADVVTLAPAARLTITLVGNSAQISWPASATDEGFSLRQAFNLDQPVNWFPVDAGVERVGDRDVVTLPAAAGNAFFQLVK